MTASRLGPVLADRLAVLQAGRVAIGAVGLTILAFWPRVATSGWSAWPTIAAWLVLTSVAEAVRRASVGRLHGLAVCALALDGIVLGVLVAHTGVHRSPLLALVHLHVVGVSLLVSHRVALRVSIWHGVMLFTAYVLGAAGVAGWRLPTGSGALAAAQEAALQATGFLLVALGIALASAVNERVVGRARRELRVVAEAGTAVALAGDDAGLVRAAAVAVREALGLSSVGIALHVGEVAVGSVADGAGVHDVSVSHLDPAAARPGVKLLHELDADEPALVDLARVPRNHVVVPLRADGVEGVLVASVGGGRRTRLPATTVAALEQVGRIVSTAAENRALHARLERLATRDGLTGLANRRFFDASFEQAVEHARRTGEAFSLVVLDVDHFKAVNDVHGHQAGDDVLRQVGSSLAGAVRAADLAARFGGEEFVVLLRGCGPDDAVRVAEEVRRAAIISSGPVPVTVSAGVASFPRDAGTADALLHAADEALYAAKRGGRDRLVAAEPRLRVVPAA